MIEELKQRLHAKAEGIYNFLDVNDRYQLNIKDARKEVEGPKINC